MLHLFRSLPQESLRLIVFDLDGTLIDSRQDLCNSVNATLANFGLRALPDDVIASYIGDGAVIDPQCNTVDVGIVVKTDLVTDKYVQRYGSYANFRNDE